MLLASLLFILFSCSSETTKPNSTSLPSLQRLIEASKDSTPTPPQFISTSDNIQLAYHAYIPDNPRATLILYHGGAAYSGAGYQLIGEGLNKHYGVAVYLPDLRGHGDSQGDKGDAPEPEQVWKDVNTLIQLVNSQYPNLPLFLGGHSAGAGMIVNYSSWEHRKAVTGYVFLSPQLGYRSETKWTDKESSFVSVSTASFVLNSMSFGLLCGHCKAVKFNYPANLDPKRVRYNTVNMANSLTPTNPHEQFRLLDQPFGMWIGENDGLFIPKKVIAFAELATTVKKDSFFRIIPGEEHLSILIKAHRYIGPWIIQYIENAEPKKL